MRFAFLLLVVGCLPPPAAPDAGTTMATVYTAAADAIVSGGAVQITEPDDGDADTAASSNTPDKKLADVIKKLINQAPLFGISPSITDAKLTNGLLFASEASNSGKVRIYMRPNTAGAGPYVGFRELFFTENAFWNGAVWAPDTAGGQDSFGVAMMMGQSSLSPTLTLLHHDNTLAATWADAAWEQAITSYQGVVVNQGQLLASPAPINITYGLNWGADGTAVLAKVWKDPLGVKHLEGTFQNTVDNTAAIGSVPAGYFPAHNAVLNVIGYNAADNALVPLRVQVDTTGGLSVFDGPGGWDHTLYKRFAVDGLSYR